ncbi:palmitoyl-CoA hydrolase Ecym_7379 [Eremothecium cymbalariae DBVPG|uniref:Acyl-CoA thioesterase II n=1 Tax=Eremothecium cymbalariae (strain CBS 270.75 / DBVPG 7215 / KCTC 17166 / NRRL Y-17582) TaxID=931890 RepID=G8JWJ0_ERECY|nr:hypothetical protein Ecym_7379 [Eremothecium cymbalariae DBVPG\
MGIFRKPPAGSLEAILDLNQLAVNKFITANRPVAPAASNVTFGGTMVGQSLLASFYTMSEDFVPASMHCSFLMGGDPTIPIIYNVEPLREGRNFTHKQVKAFQDDKLIFISNWVFSRQRELGPPNLQNVGRIAVPDKDKFDVGSTLLRKYLDDPNNGESKESKEAQGTIATALDKGPAKYWLPKDFFSGERKHEELNYFIKLRNSITNNESLRRPAGEKLTFLNDHRANYLAISYYSDAYFLLSLPYFYGLPLFNCKISVSMDHSIYFHQSPSMSNEMYLRITNEESNDGLHVMKSEWYDSVTKEKKITALQGALVVYNMDDEKPDAKL